MQAAVYLNPDKYMQAFLRYSQMVIRDLNKTLHIFDGLQVSATSVPEPLPAMRV